MYGTTQSDSTAAETSAIEESPDQLTSHEAQQKAIVDKCNDFGLSQDAGDRIVKEIKVTITIIYLTDTDFSVHDLVFSIQILLFLIKSSYKFSGTFKEKLTSNCLDREKSPSVGDNADLPEASEAKRIVEQHRFVIYVLYELNIIVNHSTFHNIFFNFDIGI